MNFFPCTRQPLRSLRTASERPTVQLRPDAGSLGKWLSLHTRTQPRRAAAPAEPGVKAGLCSCVRPAPCRLLSLSNLLKGSQNTGKQCPDSACRLSCPAVTPRTSVRRVLRQEYGCGCHALLQGVFLTQGWGSGPLHWQADSLPLSHMGSSYLLDYCLIRKSITQEGPGGRNPENSKRCRASTPFQAASLPAASRVHQPGNSEPCAWGLLWSLPYIDLVG